jgi:hypothetical protein
LTDGAPREFTARALGNLALADDALRETLRTYLQEQSNGHAPLSHSARTATPS